MREYKELIDRLKCYADTADDMVYGICVNAPEAMKAAADVIEQLVKERDAAVRDLKTYGRVCRICRELDSCYSKCPRMNLKCDTIYNECWEWRGVRKEQENEEGNGDK